MCSICPLGYMCTKCLMVSRPGRNWSHALLRVKKILDIFNSFWSNTNPAKTIFFPSLPLSGFGNRCVQPKGPREPPLEWTWWNDPSASPLTVLAGVGLSWPPLAGPKKYQVDWCYKDWQRNLTQKHILCNSVQTPSPDWAPPPPPPLAPPISPSFKVPLSKAEEHFLVKVTCPF